LPKVYKIGKNIFWAPLWKNEVILNFISLRMILLIVQTISESFTVISLCYQKL